MLVEEQIQVRRERAPDAIKKVVSRPRKGAYGDYEVQSASGKKYRVAMRGPGVFENYCSCPDFAVNLKIGFERLHGGVPSAKRGKLLERFRKDADCKVFLSTDAGGVGLNLQAASAVIPRLSKDLCRPDRGADGSPRLTWPAVPRHRGLPSAPLSGSLR